MNKKLNIKKWLPLVFFALIFLFSPLVSSAILLLLVLYSWIIGTKIAYGKEETDLWWNKKVLYAIGFLALSVFIFRSWDSWLNFTDKIHTTNIDYFMLENLKLGFTTFEIFFDGPLVLGVIFFIFYMYFGIKGLKQSFGIEKKSTLINISSVVLLGILLFLIEVFFALGA